MRRFIVLSALFAFCFAISAPGTKNVLFLQCDSMDGRVLDPTSYVSKAPQSKNLFALARKGVNFINHYSNSPQCVPSRASMWTGLHVDKTLTWNNGQGLCGQWKGYQCVNQNVTGLFTIISQIFNSAGYDVNLIGKVDIGGNYGGGFHGTNAGLAAWTRGANITRPTRTGPEVNNNDPAPHQGDWNTIEKCVKYLRQREASRKTNQALQPFFLYCSVNIPHPQYDTNSTWLKLVNESAIRLPQWQDWNKMHPYDQFMTMSKCVLRNDCEGFHATSEQLFNIRRAWYAMCAQTDAMMGAVIDQLMKTSDAENTIILFTSDHGEMNTEHRQWYKNAMYEPSTRVPLIFSGPGIRTNVQVSQPTSLLDIFPTLMDLTGLKGPQGLQGYSLAPFLLTTSKKIARPDYIISQYHSNFANTGSFMIRQGDWKYIVFGQPLPVPNKVIYKPMLFNITADENELNDLSAQFPEVVQRLDTLLRSQWNYVEIDKQVKQQDVDKYIAWQNEQQNVWKFWNNYYQGFDANDKTKVKLWLSFYNQTVTQ